MTWQYSRGTGQGKEVNKAEREIKTGISTKKRKKDISQKTLL